MAVDRAWVQRNLGFDPIANPPPANTFTFAKAATSSKPEDFQREIIDFDSEAPSGREFLAFSTATGLSRYIDVKWPKGLAPTPAKSINRGSADPLPAADVLVVTWTVDEGHALSRVLTPGKDTHNDYLPYTNNFATISKKMRNGCPALQAMRLGILLDHHHRQKIGRGVQIGFAHVAGRPAIAEYRPLAANHWASEAEARHHHRHRGRHRQGVRSRRRHRQLDRALRLPRKIQERAVRVESLCERAGQDEILCDRKIAVQNQCNAAAERQ
jgi:hypothetical protein